VAADGPELVVVEAVVLLPLSVSLLISLCCFAGGVPVVVPLAKGQAAHAEPAELIRTRAVNTLNAFILILLKEVSSLTEDYSEDYAGSNRDGSEHTQREVVFASKK
jgi:hypothetical protein